MPGSTRSIGSRTEHVNQSLPDTQVGANDHGPVAALKEALVRLSEVVGERFVDEAPALRPMVDGVKRLELSLPAEPAAEPEPAA